MTGNAEEIADGHGQEPLVKKEKIHTIMEAASALTALGDEESESSRPTSPSREPKDAAEQPATATTDVSPTEKKITDEEVASNNAQRFLPEHKKPDAAPTFPEKLMALMRYADEQGKDNKDFCVAWLPEGKSFVIRNPDEFARQIVPQYFKATKFSSFTRKLYRWGFRQINRGIGPDDPIIFGNEFFDRNNESLMTQMRSVTAAGTRKTEQRLPYGKRAFDGMFDGGQDQKRFLFDHLMQQQQKNPNMMHPNASLYGMNPNGMNPNGMNPNGMNLNGMNPNGMNSNGMNSNGMNSNGVHSNGMHSNGMNSNGTMPLPNTMRQGVMGGMDQGTYSQMMGMNKPYEMMPSQGGPSMNHQYNPIMHHQQQQQQQQPPQGMGAPNVPHGQGFVSSQSTAEIVNAAIRALQFSN